MKKCLLAFILLAGRAGAQKFDSLALTPPMGWNSWNTFQTKINERLVEDIADSMVSSGMRYAGYTYIVLDDGWMTKDRDSQGHLVPDPQKFPHGIKALADYIHAKGLKFGLYNCAGTKTCAGYPGGHGHEEMDALDYAAWGVDYLKYDWCNTDGLDAREAYKAMSEALKKAGRPIIFSLCEWGQHKPWEWAQTVGHLWRTTGDIYPCFDCIKQNTGWRALGVMRIADMQQGLEGYAGPGHWNDPDMLEVGNGMSTSEDRAHFSLWCMLSAPLMAGNDLRSMSAETKKILTNPRVVLLDQDPLGVEAHLHGVRDSVQIWARPLQNGDWAVCFLNRSTMPKQISFDWHELSDSLAAHTYTLFDLWAGNGLGTTGKPLEATVPPHDVLLVRLRY
jgi:alpha-galactosidase